jgi:hypothetical protein
MKPFLKLISYLGLALSVVPPLLVWTGRLDMATNYVLLNIGMVLWFGSAILWIKPDKHEA